MLSVSLMSLAPCHLRCGHGWWVSQFKAQVASSKDTEVDDRQWLDAHHCQLLLSFTFGDISGEQLYRASPLLWPGPQPFRFFQRNRVITVLLVSQWGGVRRAWGWSSVDLASGSGSTPSSLSGPEGVTSTVQAPVSVQWEPQPQLSFPGEL